MAKTLTSYGAVCYDVPEILHVQYTVLAMLLSPLKMMLRHIDNEFDFDDDDLDRGESVQDRLKKIIEDVRVGQVSKFLNTQGNVHIGMMSCYQFVEM
ncbi:MAG: hypothetical protein HOO93_05110 [Methyloglobulus sp.]|nr:hypothetical protein [Methyloglobulus sp.]